MAPRPIDDSAVLLEIAIEMIYNPGSKFAPVYRAATARVSAHQHSDESARRRLHRKFSRNKSYWMERGQQENELRPAAQYRQRLDQMAHLAQQMRPTMEAVSKMMERYRPAIQAAHAQFNSPAMRQALKQYETILGRVPRLPLGPGFK